MNIEIENPPAYDAETMSRKFIQAVYGESMEEFVTRIALEAAQGREILDQ